MTTKLQALADQLWRKAQTHGKAGIQLDGGLAIACYVQDKRLIVRFGRSHVPPSEHEITICQTPFAIPPTADRREYAKEPDWRIVQFSWSTGPTGTPDTHLHRGCAASLQARRAGAGAVSSAGGAGAGGWSPQKELKR